MAKKQKNTKNTQKNNKVVTLDNKTTNRQPKPRFKVSTGAQSRSRTQILDSQREKQLPPEPVVLYTPKAWEKMTHIVDTCELEVGWMGLVRELTESVYLIHDVILPDQEVTATETDISADAMGDIAMELMDQGGDPSEMYAWFHSHVNMGVTPSKQDEDQVAEFLESCPVFIRGIMNKRGDSKVDVYYPQDGIAYNCVPTDVFYNALSKEEADELNDQIKARVKRYRPPVTQNRRGPYNHGQPAGYGGPDNYYTGKKNQPSEQQTLSWADLIDAYPDDDDGEFDDIVDRAVARQEDPEDVYVDTGFGFNWDTDTPPAQRPEGWELDPYYLQEGVDTDTFASAAKYEIR